MSNAKTRGKDWRARAGKLARSAYEDHFDIRRGVWCFRRPGFLCLYNNHPYTNFPRLRDQELAEFRERLLAEGIRELAYATYPPEGQESAGYTYALLLDAGRDREEWVRQTMQEIIMDLWRKNNADGGHDG